jgi:hypothetical protein
VYDNLYSLFATGLLQLDHTSYPEKLEKCKHFKETIAAALIIEPLWCIICRENTLDRSAISGLLFPLTIDPRGSIISAATVWNFALSGRHH